MQPNITIQKAGSYDFDAVCALLQQEHLPITDLNSLLENFFIAVDEGRTIGLIGMDRYGNDGLLRSAVVQAPYRNLGIASILIQQLFDYAAQRGVNTLYLVTHTAEKYFEKKGFTKIAREDVAPGVLQSQELNGLCPASSVIMFCRL